MNSMINLAGLATATLLAAAAALGLDWLLLRAAFHLMRPAAVRSVNDCTALVRGAKQTARAFAGRR